MLQTRYKSRLSQGFSYPLGLQDLERALGDLSQAAELHVSFYDCPPGLHKTNFRTSVKRDLPHQVLAARFAKWDKRPSMSNSTFRMLIRHIVEPLKHRELRVRTPLAHGCCLRRRVFFDRGRECFELVSRGEEAEGVIAAKARVQRS